MVFSYDYMKLSSSAFLNNQNIPKKFGFNYENMNPPLLIEDVPPKTKSLVLIMDDPDAKAAVGKIWVHWLLWNISPTTTEICENSIPLNSVQGINDFEEIKYGGPAPPDKEHVYFFKLYAISKSLDIPTGSTKTILEKEISDCILEQTTLTGKYFPQ